MLNTKIKFKGFYLNETYLQNYLHCIILISVLNIYQQTTEFNAIRT